MKYNLLEIRKFGDAWNCFHKEDDRDRVKENTKPSPLGFYYYPQTMGFKKAFEKLKACMIKAHEKEIKKLQKSKDILDRFKSD